MWAKSSTFNKDFFGRAKLTHSCSVLNLTGEMPLVPANVKSLPIKKLDRHVSELNMHYTFQTKSRRCKQVAPAKTAMEYLKEEI